MNILSGKQRSIVKKQFRKDFRVVIQQVGYTFSDDFRPSTYREKNFELGVAGILDEHPTNLVEKKNLTGRPIVLFPMQALKRWF